MGNQAEIHEQDVNEHLTVAIIGGSGKMGTAISEQLQADGQTVINIGRDDYTAGIDQAGVVVVAVKPQQFDEAVESMEGRLREDQVVLSIMAGKRTDELAAKLGTEKVVRTMPNLALANGQSMTAWFAREGVLNAVEEAQIEAILAEWGETIRLTDEAQFDAFTALAGSGIAFYAEMAHWLTYAAVAHGFSEADAEKIANQVLHGAASIVGEQYSAGELSQRVASKGGTTEAALGVLRQHARGLGSLVMRAVDAATNRSRQLGQR